MLELCIDRRTGLIVAVTEAGRNWTARESDGPNLCVQKCADDFFSKFGVKAPELSGGVCIYPAQTLMRDRYVKSLLASTGQKDLTYDQAEAIATARFDPLFRVDAKQVAPNKTLLAEHLTAESPVPIIDMRMMAAANSYVEKGINSDGGADYQFLQTCWNDLKADTDTAVWMNCQAGSASMGPLDLSGAGHTPNATYYERIFAEYTNRHNGIAGSAGAFVSSNGATTNTIDVLLPYARIEGLRISQNASAGVCIGVSTTDAVTTGVVIDGVMLENADAANSSRGLAVGARAAGSETETVQNCIVYGPNNNKAFTYGILLYCNHASAVVTVNLYNCTVSQMTTEAAPLFGGIAFAEYAGTCNATCTNCIATGSTKDFNQYRTPNVTAAYCMSEDATADDWGGAGHLVSQTVGDIYVNEASDLHLKAGSPAIHTGTSVGVTYDAVGRNWLTPPSRGALEYGGPFPHYTRRRMQGGMIGMG